MSIMYTTNTLWVFLFRTTWHMVAGGIPKETIISVPVVAVNSKGHAMLEGGCFKRHVFRVPVAQRMPPYIKLCIYGTSISHLIVIRAPVSIFSPRYCLVYWNRRVMIGRDVTHAHLWNHNFLPTNKVLKNERPKCSSSTVSHSKPKRDADADAGSAMGISTNALLGKERHESMMTPKPYVHYTLRPFVNSHLPTPSGYV